MSVTPIAAKDVEKWRYGNQEWATLADTPEEFAKLTLGNFEAFFQGRWRKLSGSYMAGEPGHEEPWIWIEK